MAFNIVVSHGKLVMLLYVCWCLGSYILHGFAVLCVVQCMYY